MVECKPKFKFKKPTNASLKKKRLRRDPTDEDVPNPDSISSTNETTSTGNVVDSEEPSALDKIREVERRRKLLSTRNRGVDAANLGKHTLKHKESEEDEVVVTRNKDLEERLKGTFAEGKLAGSNDMGGDEEGGILAKKHKKAMEEYINSNLQSEAGSSAATIREEGEKFKSSADVEKEMYSDLLATSDTDAKNAETAKKDEGDVGAGGAMMGGTGIAEVTLPIDERIKAVKDTERAAMEYERARKARLGIVDEEGIARDNASTTNNMKPSSTVMDSATLSSLVPMNFASGPGKRKRKEMPIPTPNVPTPQQKPLETFDPTQDFKYPVHSSAIPAGSFIQKNSDASNLGASYSHNFAQHNREWIEQKKDERQAEINAITAQKEAEESHEESRARVGFEVARKLARGEVVETAGSGSAGGAELKNEWDRKHGSNDHRVWKTFMSNQKNRR